jgi:ATP-dependent RNA helicase DOB1
VLYAWTLGAKFADVLKLTDAFEGTIIRAIRRLEEMLRQLASASHAIGDHGLKEKFEEASKKIRRDIVFAASLYL